MCFEFDPDVALFDLLALLAYSASDFLIVYGPIKSTLSSDLL